MSTTKRSALEELLASSALVCCARCGATATYRGDPKEINAAAKDFYELHERICYQRKQAETEGRRG